MDRRIVPSEDLVDGVYADISHTVRDQVDFLRCGAGEIDNPSVDEWTSIIDGDDDLASTLPNDADFCAETQRPVRRREFRRKVGLAARSWVSG